MDSMEESHETVVQAAQLLWDEQALGREPTDLEWGRMMEQVLANKAKVEQDALQWMNFKLAKPPRSGLWSHLYPLGVGWLFLLVLMAFGLVALIASRAN